MGTGIWGEIGCILNRADTPRNARSSRAGLCSSLLPHKTDTENLVGHVEVVALISVGGTYSVRICLRTIPAFMDHRIDHLENIPCHPYAHR